MHKLDFTSAKAGLKKVQTKDNSGPRTEENAFISQQEISKYHDSVFAVNFECWADLLADLSFESFTFPVTTEHAKELVKAYENNVNKNETELSPVVEQLVDELQQFLDSKLNANEKFFAKMSARSAKDAPVFAERTKEFYKQSLQRLLQALPEEEKANADSIANCQTQALLESGTAALQMSSAKDVIELFVRSERIWQDLELALSHPERFQEQIIIRRWVPIDVDMEFRAFVCNKKLTAISQYNYICHFQRLHDQKQELCETLEQFFEKEVKPRLDEKFTDYVIDFAVTGGALDRLYVIELNPFAFSTDAALFSWAKDEDILRNGPFEFRLRDRGGIDINKVNFSWREIVNSCPV